LAVDISRASLAYASRKTREAGLRNIEYAQADILKLGALERRFDHIEAIGVLHHLADPKVGWRVLLSLLKPQGTMRVGLYSGIAGRAIADARSIIASEGYQPTPEGIRALRRHMMGDAFRWRAVMQPEDFYYMSGCRDLLFHVIEHRFTLPDIAAFLKEQGLQLVGFEPTPDERRDRCVWQSQRSLLRFGEH
jgi:SAM-dependent methyltransferase